MERPLRPEEASSEQGEYLTGPQGKFGCHHCYQVHSSSVWARLTRPPKKEKKRGRSQEHVPLTLVVRSLRLWPTRARPDGRGL